MQNVHELQKTFPVARPGKTKCDKIILEPIHPFNATAWLGSNEGLIIVVENSVECNFDYI